MPRITKKMKLEELKNLENQILYYLLFATGLSVNKYNNVCDENNNRLTILENNVEKFIKWGDGPFRYREIKFDLYNFKLINHLFSNIFINNILEDDPNIYIRSIALKDNFITTIKKKEEVLLNLKYLEIDLLDHKLVSNNYIIPTLPFIELIFSYTYNNIIPINGGVNTTEILKRLDQLKYELE